MKRVLHIVPDDKFIDYFKKIDECTNSVESYYLVKKQDLKSNYQYLNLDYQNRIIWKRNDLKFVDIYFNKFDAIFFHTIDPFVYYLLNKIDTKIKIFWFYWGYEINYLIGEKRLYYDKTKKQLYLNEKIKNINLIKSFKELIKFYRDRAKFKKVLKRVDYCITWCRNDYNEIHRKFSNLKFLNFCYYTKELLRFNESLNEKNDLLVLGNSSNPSNNHIDALNFLNKIKYRGNVVIPFSYGGDSHYKKSVKNYSVKLNYCKIQFLDKFLNIEEYNKIVSKAYGFLFFHKRQQASGNYIAAFFMKKPVFYFEETNLISDLNKMGFKLYKLEEFNSVSSSQLEINYNLANNIFSIDQSIKQLSKIYSFLN